MSNLTEIPKDVSIDTLLSEIMPELSREMLKEANAGGELDGVDVSMVVEVDGNIYSYEVKNGESINFAKADLDNAMLRMKITEADMTKMIETGNLDMILGIQKDLSKAKYNALSSLRGSFIAEVTELDDASSSVSLDVTLNGAADPKCTFIMSAANTTALMNKETNPVNLFMSGAMKIEGDMGFAMATQPLFS